MKRAPTFEDSSKTLFAVDIDKVGAHSDGQYSVSRPWLADDLRRGNAQSGHHESTANADDCAPEITADSGMTNTDLNVRGRRSKQRHEGQVGKVRGEHTALLKLGCRPPVGYSGPKNEEINNATAAVNMHQAALGVASNGSSKISVADKDSKRHHKVSIKKAEAPSAPLLAQLDSQPDSSSEWQSPLGNGRSVGPTLLCTSILPLPSLVLLTDRLLAARSQLSQLIQATCCFRPDLFLSSSIGAVLCIRFDSQTRISFCCCLQMGQKGGSNSRQ